MPRRIIRTTRKIQYNEDGEPIETVVSRQEQQPVDPLTGNAQETVYEPASTQQRVTYTYPPATQPVQETQVYDPETGVQRVSYTYPAAPTVQQTELVEPQWSRTLRRVTDRQLQILRNMDMRISNLEAADDQGVADASFERATWWALWGILMIILGAALVVILFLILTGLPH